MAKVKASFAVGTGRCGTTLMARLMQMHDNIDSFHELNPLNETFHRYCRWNELPVDDAGFLYQKDLEMKASHEAGRLFFESSAYLSLSVETLARHYDAQFVLMVRHPEQVINSYLKKGWYLAPPVIDNPDLAPGFQPTAEFHHFLGRPIPHKSELEEWRAMGRPGKLAWYWATLNASVLGAFQSLGPERCRVQKLEDLSHDSYSDLAAFLGADSPLPKADVTQLIESKPNAFSNLPTTGQWTATDHQEVLRHVGPVADALGYDTAQLSEARHA
ncbi:sulfotransferase family protein [Kordiimonas aestuarii]|uniref:hypothetical protein n=1 Tax=Kordiimonas aestuarii TaxID=1005925 RepID=UPI0021D26968|nr:hypothetical protein [Kordiimonas aestuarii]